MPVPVQNFQVVAQGLARLTGAFVNQPNIRAWLTAILTEVQALENAAFSVYGGRILATAPQLALPAMNPVFDSLGSLIGQPRVGMNDTAYVTAIRLRAAANRATGRIGDWSNFGAILLRAGAGPVVYYATTDETPGAWGPAFYFGVWNCANGSPDPMIAANCLDMGVPQGVGCTFAYSTWPDGGDFAPGSIYDATAGQGGLGDANNSATGGMLVSAVALA